MLSVDQLVCGYGDIQAVKGISFTVEPGEVFGLIGSNGAGKTSTILAIAGLIDTREGKITIDGTVMNDVPAHRRIDHGLALVPEGRRVFADLSVDENLTVGGTRLSNEQLDQNQQRIFDLFPRLAERRRQLAGSLSGGEQQMLAIGRAVMAQPRILLIDELSLGLMPKAIDECYAILHQLQQDGIAILLVEQSTERVLQFATHIAVLESGNVVWTGTGEDASNNNRDDNKILDAYLGLGE